MCAPTRNVPKKRGSLPRRSLAVPMWCHSGGGRSQLRGHSPPVPPRLPRLVVSLTAEPRHRNGRAVHGAGCRRGQEQDDVCERGRFDPA